MINSTKITLFKRNINKFKIPFFNFLVSDETSKKTYLLIHTAVTQNLVGRSYREQYSQNAFYSYKYGRNGSVNMTNKINDKENSGVNMNLFFLRKSYIDLSCNLFHSINSQIHNRTFHLQMNF